MIAEIVARLASEVPDLADVVVAEDTDALMRGPAPRDYTAFVVPLGETAQANTIAAGGFRQLVTDRIVVAFVTRHHDDLRGSQRAALFTGRKGAIEAALAGWTPPGALSPLQLIGGNSNGLGNGVSLYAQTWTTQRFLTGA